MVSTNPTRPKSIFEDNRTPVEIAQDVDLVALLRILDDITPDHIPRLGAGDRQVLRGRLMRVLEMLT